MLDLIEQFILAHASLAYFLAFAGAFFESIAFIGIFVPGTVITAAAGFLSEQWPGSFIFSWFFLLAFLGAGLGNIVTYLLGRYYGPPLFSEKNFYLKRQYLERAQEYFEVHGGKSIFMAQFLGPLRPIVPLVAGMAEMPMWRYISWTVVASAAWALVYLSIGYFFGASWEAVQLWGTRLTFFVLLMVGLFVVNLIIGRFLVLHERQVRKVVFSIGQSILAGFLGNEYIASLLQRFPRFFGFFKNRFSIRSTFGLPFSVAVVISLIILFYLLMVIRAIIAQGPLWAVDERLFAATMFVRDPLLNSLVHFLTNLAGPPAIVIALALSFMLWLDGREYRIFVFLIGTPIVYLYQWLLKSIFYRSRPDQIYALVTETSPSFPSAHAVVAIIVYGFLLFFLLKYIQRWRVKVAAILSLATLIFLIGFSRVYLGVHWPSDVLGGYLLGGWWLTVMLTVAYVGEKTFYQVKPPKITPLNKFIVAVLLLAISLATVKVYGAYDPLRTIERDTVVVLPIVRAKAFSSELLFSLPRQTETLAGRQQAPINLVFVGSRHDVSVAFQKAGWEMAEPINLQSALKMITTSLQNAPYPTAPFSPQFYDGRVHDIGFQKSTSLDSVRQRHHVRLWLAPIALSDNEIVWQANASFDKGIAYSPVLKFPTHIIDPNIDKERDYIRGDLAAVGSIGRQETVQLVEPVLGTTGSGSPFFTDGKAHVLWILPQP